MQTKINQNDINNCVIFSKKQKKQRKTYRKYIKRLLDFKLSLIAIICLAPVLLLTGILVRIYLGRPILFKQKRPGLNEKIFVLYKFRSMTDERDEKNEYISDTLRLTKFGRFLRATSLDELPELFNILKGDMSFVGPRPLAIQYLPYYTNEERERHSVRPGLSGLAQVNGRNALSWEKRFFYDIMYVKNITFWNDMKIVLRTLNKVIKGTDIGERGVDAPVDFDKYRNNIL